MGIQKSNLNNKEIKNILEEKYGIFPNNITKLNRGTANIFKIDDNKCSYILKEFDSNIQEDIIEKEVNIINF